MAHQKLAQAIAPVADGMRSSVLERFQTLAKPPGSLGRLEQCVAEMAAIQNRPDPTAERAALWLFAADHGLARDGVTAWPQAVTGGMLGSFTRGKAAINQICRANDMVFKAVDAGVAVIPHGMGDYHDLSMGPGTDSALHGPAMSREAAEEAVHRGHSLIAGVETPAELIAFGEMGIGNTAAASLITHALTGQPLGDCVGRGAGLDADGLERKREVLEQVMQRHGRPKDAVSMLACFGGYEIAMIAGAALAAAARRQVILVDGFIATAAIALACHMAPLLRDYCIFCHRSAEPGHAHLLEHLSAEPLLDLDMALGEGTGAAMAVPLIRSAVACFRDMESVEAVLATLPEAAVAG